MSHLIPSTKNGNKKKGGNEMKLRAIHRRVRHDNTPIEEEVVVIILISDNNPELLPSATYVREDGTMSTDSIDRFIITDGAW